MRPTGVRELSWVLFGAGLGLMFCLGVLFGAALQWAR